MDDLEAAWDELHDAVPPGWRAGRPWYHDEARTWELYAYDTRERRRRGMGHRSHEWTAMGTTEAECVREMARCLREIAAGRWPT